jgi:flagellar assembly protein FliH
MAERILRQSLPKTPDVTLTLVREALELAAGGARIKLHLNPQDHDALKPQLEQLAGELADLGPTHIVADPQVTHGGCRVETEFGTIDQQFEAQLARIEEELC